MLLWSSSSLTFLHLLAPQVVPSLPRHHPACSLPPLLLLRQALIPPSLPLSGSVRCPCWTAARLTPCWSRPPRTSSHPIPTCSELRLPTPPPPQVRTRVSVSALPTALPPSYPASITQHITSITCFSIFISLHLTLHTESRATDPAFFIWRFWIRYRCID